MTDRTDITPTASGFRRLSYTCRCGRVDWGHASPGRPENHNSTSGLKRQMDREQANWPGLDRLDIQFLREPAFVVVYGQSMGSATLRISVSNVRHWVVKKNLTARQRERVALSIFMATSMNFERLQGSFPYGLVSGASSFSPEDLVSNLIGFYSVFRGVPVERLRTMCGEVSVNESLRIWDAHLPNGFGGLRNTTTRPILFPSAACAGNTEFPTELSDLAAALPGTHFVAPSNRFIDGRLVNAGLPLQIDATGVIRRR
jgi:hypothetical protein